MAKLLGGQIAPVMLAGLLYLGSGIGLLVWYLARRWLHGQGKERNGLRLPDLPWLAGAILAGGIAGPVLLMTGLSTMPASTSSLLLNLEGVLTAVLAWMVFRENVDRRVLLGMVLIVIAGVLLSWEDAASSAIPWGAIAIAGACLCWAIDNNLTRKVSGSDAVQIAGIKGLTAGIVNLTIAVQLKQPFPVMEAIASVAIVGFLGYGLSLVLFVLALRHLGTARTGAYFSAAPFVGATLSLMILGEVPGMLFWIAAALMAAGIWLHVTERHSHEHTHEPLAHAHPHVHDEHHQHEHDADWDGKEPHSHFHVHQPITHSHPHYPDLHHRHRH